MLAPGLAFMYACSYGMREVSIQTISGFDEDFVVAVEAPGTASARPATTTTPSATRLRSERPRQDLRLKNDFMIVGSTPSVL
jgi:hypothetical protein